MNNFALLEDILPKLSFDDETTGAALSVFYDGRVVVNTAFGNARADKVWTPDTLSVNFSIGKGVMATLIAVLVSKGLLDYHRPICADWADFIQNGKADVRLIDVLTHRADLFDITSVTDSQGTLGEWQTMLKKVAAMPKTAAKDPKAVGFASAYSALVSGWVLGGLVEKATDMPLQKALDAYLARPLGIEGGLYFGLPKDKQDRIALPKWLFFADQPRPKPVLKKDSQKALDLYQSLPIKAWGELETLDTQSIAKLYFDPSKMNLINYKNALMLDGKTPVNYYDSKLLASPIPAANGVSTSLALATLYAMHANDGVWQGQTMIDQATLQTMRTIYSDGFDAVMPANMHWRAGFHRLFSTQNTPNAYGHMGYNGSVAFCDPDRRLALAFIHNFDTVMLNDVRQFVLSELAVMLADG